MFHNHFGFLRVLDIRHVISLASKRVFFLAKTPRMKREIAKTAVTTAKGNSGIEGDGVGVKLGEGLTFEDVLCGYDAVGFGVGVGLSEDVVVGVGVRVAAGEDIDVGVGVLVGIVEGVGVDVDVFTA
jgi:hypothetical protein